MIGRTPSGGWICKPILTARCTMFQRTMTKTIETTTERNSLVRWAIEGTKKGEVQTTWRGIAERQQRSGQEHDQEEEGDE